MQRSKKSEYKIIGVYATTQIKSKNNKESTLPYFELFSKLAKKLFIGSLFITKYSEEFKTKAIQKDKKII